MILNLNTYNCQLRTKFLYITRAYLLFKKVIKYKYN